MPNDIYQTITQRSEGLFKDRGSKFIAVAFPVYSEDEVQQRLDELRKEFYDARHHCFAYQLGADKMKFRTNDDGEPSNSAGKPILGQINAKDLTNVLVVVIRYFGGTLLGVGGLITAYKTAAAEALNNANIITKTVDNIIEFEYEYPDTNDVMRIFNDENIQPIDKAFAVKCEATLSIRKSHTERIVKRLKKVKSVKIKSNTKT